MDAPLYAAPPRAMSTRDAAEKFHAGMAAWNFAEA
jgi:hypothetical protein